MSYWGGSTAGGWSEPVILSGDEASTGSARGPRRILGGAGGRSREPAPTRPTRFLVASLLGLTVEISGSEAASRTRTSLRETCRPPGGSA